MLTAGGAFIGVPASIEHRSVAGVRLSARQAGLPDDSSDGDPLLGGHLSAEPLATGGHREPDTLPTGDAWSRQ